MSTVPVEKARVVSGEEWLAARRDLLAREKQLTREYDAVRALRRELPWVKVEKNYVFDGPNGKETLSDLFAGRSQLIVRHFMFGPGWKEGCVGCSFASDHVDGALVHLQHHDVTYVAVSRAPFTEIEGFRQRMGWSFKWLSSFNSEFNYDYHVSFAQEEIAQGKVFYNFEMRDLPFNIDEMSGVSVFVKDGSGDIFHTYSCHARGDEGGLTTYFYLDLTPRGRDENGPTYTLADWVRHHDRYEAGGHVAPSGRYVAPSAEEAKR
ncbi:MAG TPA: thioredoxin family protein [Silvibacterium sp.]|nr:thioredoxin family protein [Silvibacterium sp.]